MIQLTVPIFGDNFSSHFVTYIYLNKIFNINLGFLSSSEKANSFIHSFNLSFFLSFFPSFIAPLSQTHASTHAHLEDFWPTPDGRKKELIKERKENER
jgi:hypothetical protein